LLDSTAQSPIEVEGSFDLVLSSCIETNRQRETHQYLRMVTTLPANLSTLPVTASITWLPLTAYSEPAILASRGTAISRRPSLSPGRFSVNSLTVFFSWLTASSIFDPALNSSAPFDSSRLNLEPLLVMTSESLPASFSDARRNCATSLRLEATIRSPRPAAPATTRSSNAAPTPPKKTAAAAWPATSLVASRTSLELPCSRSS